MSRPYALISCLIRNYVKLGALVRNKVLRGLSIPQRKESPMFELGKKIEAFANKTPVAVLVRAVLQRDLNRMHCYCVNWLGG